MNLVRMRLLGVTIDKYLPNDDFHDKEVMGPVKRRGNGMTYLD